MQLTKLFTAQDLLVDFRPGDKWEAIGQMLDHLCESGRIPLDAAEAAREAVLAREESMSTGMEHGIAIPHGAVDGLNEIAACMGIVGGEEGLPFDSIDGGSTRLVVVLVIPRDQKLLHIRTLADVARALSKEPVRAALAGATSPGEAWEILARNEAGAELA
ncbi:MAG: PTS sugar transporter subunit IIA [Planctomycetes bacterium]|nr:PTS sugar transporter subunit IIA [Planctomycetota bacterium]